MEFVGKGDFGVASGQKPDGSYERIWFGEIIPHDEVSFESDVYLLLKKRAKSLKNGEILQPPAPPGPTPGPGPGQEPGVISSETKTGAPEAQKKTLRLSGNIPPEIWNRLGTKLIPKLRTGSEIKIGVNFSVIVDAGNIKNFESDLRQILQDLGLGDRIRIE